MIKSNTKFSPFNWMLLGILLYELCLLFKTNTLPCVLLGGAGIIIVSFNFVFRLPHRIPFYGVKRPLFILYLFWNLFIILRSLVTTGFAGFTPFNPTGLFSFVTPLVVLIVFQHLSLKSVFKLSFVYGVIGMLLTVFFFNDIVKSDLSMTGEEYQEYISVVGKPNLFLFSTVFMVMCYDFVPSMYRKISFLSILFSTLIVLITARRGGLFMDLLFLIFTFYLYVFASKKSSTIIKLLFVLTVVIVGCGVFLMYAGSFFALLSNRLDEDSRSAVEKAFFDSFNGETLDWIFGRGLHGSYYCILFDESFVNYRDGIETGYLNIILKGGILSLLMFLYFLLNSAYLGFFKSNNTLTKAMSLYLFAHVIYLQPFGIPSFSLEYLIVWICVLYCQSEVWRNKSDEDIKSYLKQDFAINNKLKL
jgi:hypothetical protein